ncbi:MAG: choice-of-anchor Q domain-containing protein [Rudaea sp.]
MKRFAFLAFLALVPVRHASAAGIVRIANGDCAALATAASAPAGAPAAQIILARDGQYGYCPFTVAGNVTIDGNGASLGLMYSLTTSQITIVRNASLAIRNLNFVNGGDPGTANGTYVCGPFGLTCNVHTNPIITNLGSLVLDTVSANGVSQGANALVHTYGNIYLRNVTLIGSAGPYNFPLFDIDGIAGSVDVDQSTLIWGTPFSLSDSNPVSNSDVVSGSQITISNSILALPKSDFPPLCGGGGNSLAPNSLSPLNSKGGNLTTDSSCNLQGPNDRVAADAGFADFDTHGGVVGNMALNSNSPAIGNGIAANCAATDARGVARGTAACDSGAYEFGGGQGQLGASGASGLYYNQANNGHYVSVQRLGGNFALVIWNTFDETGKPAWVYGVGTISGTTIQIPQVAENVGGILHPGGAVTGATPTLWGSMTLDMSSCYAAQLHYQSTQPLFGSGSINLRRLVFVNGLDCSP